MKITKRLSRNFNSYLDLIVSDFFLKLNRATTIDFVYDYVLQLQLPGLSSEDDVSKVWRHLDDKFIRVRIDHIVKKLVDEQKLVKFDALHQILYREKGKTDTRGSCENIVLYMRNVPDLTEQINPSINILTTIRPWRF